jgi:hypothetical protein
MVSLTTLLTLGHLIGLALGVGAATVKVVLLLRCKSDSSNIQPYLKVVRPITQVLITGIILLTLSGLGWLFEGYPFSSQLIIKIIIVAAIWVAGPVIDNVVEPKFKKLAPMDNQPISSEFVKIMNKYLGLEIFATSLFYVIIFYWV